MKLLASKRMACFVKPCLIGLSATTALWLFASSASAQDAADNFQAFREKLAAERATQQAPGASSPTIGTSSPTITAPTETAPAIAATPAPAIVSPAPTVAAPAAPVMPSAEISPSMPASSAASPLISNSAPVSPALAPNVQSPISTAADVTSPLAGMASPAASSSLPAGANPLGPAANLPLNGQLPAGPQSQAEIQAALEAETAVLQKKVDDQTFDLAVKQMMPLKPAEVRKLLGIFQDNREAAETPYSSPEPKQIVATISLDPSEAPPVIKLAAGNVTTITILDSTGSPWPIQDVSWAGKFAVTPPESGGHIMRITPQSAHGVGNISIRLVDMIAPITMTLQTGLEEVYYRFDARIPKAGPMAKTPLIDYGGLKSVAGKDNAISNLLDGTPPSGARRLKVDGPDGRTTAYKINDKIYLRTPLTLLSPGWDSSATSADGINVYTVPKAPVLILSDSGRMVQTRLAEEDIKP